MTWILALALPAFAGGGPTLSVDGACPGDLDISITGGTPGADFVVFSGTERGSDAIPYGRCAGAVTGLSGGRYGFRAPDVDGDGAMSFSPYAPSGACGQFLQVLDTTTCALSAAVEIGAAGPAGDLYLADGRSSPGNLYAVDVGTGEVTTIAPLTNSYTGLTFDDAGNLFGTTGCFSSEIYQIDPVTGEESYIGDDPEGCEGSLGFDGTYLVSYEEDGCWAQIDKVSGATIASDCGASDTYYGQGLSRDASGTLWALGTIDYWTWDGSDFSVLAYSYDAGLQDSSDGGGATWHDGSVIRVENGALWMIDPVAGTSVDMGIAVSEGIDAIASATP